MPNANGAIVGEPKDLAPNENADGLENEKWLFPKSKDCLFSFFFGDLTSANAEDTTRSPRKVA